jgi:hypothetical protein
MAAVRDIPLTMETAEVLRRQGLRKGAKVRPEIRLFIREALSSLKKFRLLGPAAAYEYYMVSSVNDSRISLEGGKAIRGPLIPAIFPEAKELAAVVVTIGPKLEEQATDYSKNGEILRGMILDGIGSAPLDSLVPEVLRVIATDVSSQGYEISSPVNPGMPGFPLTEQWTLLGLVNADEIGVRLTASGILIPRKSTSMVIGIGPQMTRWTRAEVCARCSLRQSCHYKVT